MRSYLFKMIPLFSDMTAFYCIFILFSQGTDAGKMWFSFPLYVLCGLAAALANQLLARRDRSLLRVVGVNAVAALLSELVMFLAPHHIAGWFAYAVAAVIFLYPAPRSLRFARRPAEAGVMLMYTDVSIFGFALFFGAQLFPSFQPEAWVNGLCLLAIGLNIYALSSLRGESAAKARLAAKTARQGVWILIPALLLLILLTVLLGLIFLPTALATILALLGTLRDGALWVLRLFLRGLLYLASLLLDPEGGLIEGPPPLTVAPPTSIGEAEELPVWMFFGGIGGIFAVLGALFLWLLIRFRKSRLRWRTLQGNMSAVKADTPSLWEVLRSLWRRWRQQVSFYRLLLSRFNTCAGVFVRLELRGRRCGCERRPGQTPREFLAALCAAYVPEEEAGVRSAFAQLARQIDVLCFREGRATAPLKLERAQIKAMMRPLRPRRRFSWFKARR
ncbi:MAG: hypothetical protein LBT22_06090 [Peptococcaceae bacterium]|nr:hypothetical protein [Peptococcaceae bacterium]